jgi:hypothetical protein
VTGVGQRTPAGTVRPRRRWPAAVAVALGTAVLLAAGVLVWGRVADTPTAAAVLTTGWFVVALGAAAALVRRRRWLRLPLATGYGVAALATALLVGLPTVLDRTVDDGALLDVDIAAPAGSGAGTPGGATGGEPGASTAPSGTAPGRTGAAAPSRPAPRAAEIGRADLAGIDHRASGTARLIRLADGSLLVRLEDLDVESGPDYYVHLVAGADRRQPAGDSQVARLRGNRGNQNYPLAAGRTAGTPVTVLIWCRAFDTPVAAATIG